MTRRATLRSGAKVVENNPQALRDVRALECDSAQVSQVTWEGHVKGVTNGKSRKDRSVSKGETMSLERCINLKMRYRSEIASKGVKKSNRGLKDMRQGAGETRRE